MPIETFTLVLFAVSSLVFLGMMGVLTAFYWRFERSIASDAPTRRHRARLFFGVGAIGVFLSFEWLIAFFTFDIAQGALDYTQHLFVGIGGVFIASIPLSVGLALAIQASDADAGREE